MTKVLSANEIRAWKPYALRGPSGVPLGHSKEHWAILPACRRQAGLYSDAQRILTEPAVKLLSHPFGNDPFRFF